MGLSPGSEAAPVAAFPGIAGQRQGAALHPLGRNGVEDGRQAVAKPTGAGRSLSWKGRGAAPSEPRGRPRCSLLPRQR